MVQDMHIVYILKSHVDSSKTYVGLTCNLEKRLKEHNEEESYYTKRYCINRDSYYLNRQSIV